MKLVVSRRNMAEMLLSFLLILLLIFNKLKYGTVPAQVFNVLLLFIILMIIKKSILKSALPYMVYGGVWCTTFLIGTFMNSNSSYAGDLYDIFFISIMIAFTCLFMGIKFERKQIWTLLSIYTMCNLLVSVNIMFNYVTKNYYVDQRASFLIGNVYKDPNYVASLIAPAIFLLFLEVRSAQRTWQKIIGSVSLVVMLLAVFVTGSRAAFIAILISGAIYIILQWLSRETKLIYKAVITLFIMMIALVGSYILMTSENSRFTDISGYLSDIRLVIWADALSFWKRSPIIGNGIDATSNYTLTCWYGRATHNCFMDLLGDSGIIGLVCLIGIVKRFFKRLSDKRMTIAFAAICFVPQAFVNGFYAFNFWFVICLIKMLVDYNLICFEDNCQIGWENR